MDINAVSNNNISGLGSSSIQLEKSQSKSAIDTSKGGSLNLSINEYNKKRDELSLDVQSLNDGLAITKIAQNALEKQQEYLSNIQKKLENSTDLENKNDLKQSINEDLRAFNQIAYQTKYKGETLLVNNYYDEKTTIDISTKSQNYSIEKQDISTYANDIFETSNNNDLNIPEKIKDLADKVSAYSSQLNNMYEKFTDFGNKLETSARESIKEQVNLYNENQINKDRNFGKESTDFTKNNIMANAGYLAVSQANIVQAQSVRLLSS